MTVTTKRMAESLPSLFDISADPTLGAAVKFEGHSAGCVIMPSGWTDANLGFKVCDQEEGTFVILRKDDGSTPVQLENILTTGARAYQLPEELFAAAPIWVKPWSKNKIAATETDVNQTTADKTLTFMMA